MPDLLGKKVSLLASNFNIDWKSYDTIFNRIILKFTLKEKEGTYK